MTNVKSVVIVGGGLAGANAAFELRKLGFDGAVTLIGDETHLPYKRPPMSKEYLRAEKPFEKALVKPADEYASQRIDLVTGTRVVGLDPTRRAVATDDGRTIIYDALVLATGSEPRRMDVPGADMPGIHYLRNGDDADAIREAALKASSVVVVGGGWIGAEVAASLRQLGRKVTMVASPPLPLENVLGPEVAGVYRQLHEDNGIELVVGSVARFEPGVAVLDDGRRIAADVFVVGIGAIARIDLARSAGLTLRDGGVEVDEWLRSSDPNIYVAGDIAAAWNPRYGRHVRVEHWDNAVRQGKHVAANILGANEPYDRAPYFYSDQFDFGMEYRGLARDWDRVVIRGDLTAREFDAFWIKDGRVVAAMNANRWDDADELQELVEREASVEAADLTREKVAA